MNIAGLDLSPLLQSIAAKLAHMGDEEQAEFFNTFAKELAHTCETYTRFQMQACYVAGHASQECKDFFAQVSYEEPTK